MGAALAAGPAPFAEPGHDDRAWGTQQGWRAHASTVGASLATLFVIVASAVMANGGGAVVPGPDDPRAELTALGERVLDELPLAYQVDDAVVLPASADPGVYWSDAVSDERIVGHAVPMGARGLVEYSRLSSSPDAAAWTGDITAADRIFADVGPLWFACTTWPGEDRCSASVLMLHEDRYYFYRTGLGSSGFLDENGAMQVFAFDSIGNDGMQQLLVGGVDGTATKDVELSLADGSRVSAWTTTSLAAAGETIWWRQVSSPVDVVTAYDGRGNVVASTRP
jgi:hypothetical protein